MFILCLKPFWMNLNADCDSGIMAQHQWPTSVTNPTNGLVACGFGGNPPAIRLQTLVGILPWQGEPVTAARRRSTQYDQPFCEQSLWSLWCSGDRILMAMHCVCVCVLSYFLIPDMAYCYISTDYFCLFVCVSVSIWVGSVSVRASERERDKRVRAQRD